MYVSIIMMVFKQACYTATRLENISLFLADSDRSNLKESGNICCNACLQGRKGSRAEAAQTLRGWSPCWTHLKEGQWQHMLVCLEAWKVRQ